MLVNRLWCKISVRILWRNIWNIWRNILNFDVHATSTLSTLIACLPNESKVLLYKNNIFIPTPTSNPPLFNYPSFCKVLSIYEICKIVDKVLGNELYNVLGLINSLNSKERNCLVINEV